MKFINLKYLSYVCLAIIMFMVSSINVSAFDAGHGLYCGYNSTDGNFYFFTYSGFSKEDVFYLDQNFDGGPYQDTPSLGVSIEAGRPGGTVTNEVEIKWLQENGLLNSNGDFVCPTNPFGTTLGEAVEFECGESGCHIYDVPTGYETYTCKYIGQDSKKELIMTSTYDENGLKWEIKYPDGTSKTYINNEINGNLMPGKECDDVYYSNNKKKIQTVVKTGKYEIAIYQQCKDYSDLEQFCSNGSCKIENASCEQIIDKYDGNGSYNNGECPAALKTITFFIKKIVFNIIQIFIPILLILMGTLDLVKAVMASDDKAMKDAVGRLIKRIIYAIAIFFVTTVVTVIMNLFAEIPDIGAQNTWKACWFDNE